MKTLSKFVLVVLVSLWANYSMAQNIHIPAKSSMVSTVGVDGIYISPDESMVLLYRWYATALLYDLNTGKLLATGVQAYDKFYGAGGITTHSKYRENDLNHAYEIYDKDDKLINRVKKDRNKNDVRSLRGTPLILEYKYPKDKLYVHFPDGKEVLIDNVYKNKEKKDPKRKVYPRSIFSNLSIGYAYITSDYNYAFDRNGNMVNLRTGDVAKMDFEISTLTQNVLGTYDPATTILKVSDGTNVHVYQLYNMVEILEAKRSFYIGGQYQYHTVTSLPFLKSGGELDILNYGTANVQMFVVKDTTYLFHLENPNVNAEKANYNSWVAQRDREEASKQAAETARLESLGTKYVRHGGDKLQKCPRCEGSGFLDTSPVIVAQRLGKSNWVAFSHDVIVHLCPYCEGKHYVYDK